MLKSHKPVKTLKSTAARQLSTLLKQIPAIDPESVNAEFSHGEGRYDLAVQLNSSGEKKTFICEVRASGQPRHVRTAALQLHEYVSRSNWSAIPILIAPFLSAEAQAICREYDIGFLDMEGNCRLAFDGIYIERAVPTKPAIQRRELKSLFKPKSAQVLRVMLRDPVRQWRVTDLSHDAAVSVGHVSNVRTALIDKEWAAVGDHGLFLTNPDALLDAWAEAYEKPAGAHIGFYTTLHGAAFDEAAAKAFEQMKHTDAWAMFASFSAARWHAPYARTGTQFLYANDEGVDVLRSLLKLSTAAKGENVIVTRVDDTDLARDVEHPAPGINTTSLVQTYLDLAIAGERGREAADHLRREKLEWTK
jgi:hypothetical protein